MGGFSHSETDCGLVDASDLGNSDGWSLALSHPLATIALCFLFGWVFLGLVAAITALGLFRKYEDSPRLNLPPKYAHIMRQDMGHWDGKAILWGCFIRFPLYATLYFAITLLTEALSLFRKWFGLPVIVLHVFTRVAGRVVAHTLQKVVFKGNFPQKIKTPLLISNHVGEHDIFFLFTAFERPVSFLAKKEFKRMPLMASFGRDYLHNIYVDRSSP